MGSITCACFLLCIWEPVQAALLSCFGTAVADGLSSLRDRLVGQVRNLTFFRGNRVEQINTSTPCLFGQEEIHRNLEKVATCLKDDGVWIIGIYGMGGVGKTTLLELINNHFHKMGVPGFHVVIWVTVAKDADILKIQKSIGGRFGLSLYAEKIGSSSQAEEQAEAIYKALRERRFLLLLDDVWEKLNLKHVGIPEPTPENKCKIILTSRLKRVCRDMRAKEFINVKVLNKSESWKLFRDQVSTEVDLESPLIYPYAEAVVDKCGGLPLALMTVGRTMAEAESVEEWQLALKQLRESPQDLPGMEDEVLRLLKFSFDRLRDHAAKECLLYCYLFPEDYRIPVKQVIEYWVGEGFLDKTQWDSLIYARKKGREVITHLKSACLLQSADGETPGELCVKMHDVVREMCLWITSGQLDQNNTFLVYQGEGLNRALSSETWWDAKRISLMNNLSQDLPSNMSSCPRLQTLLYNSDSRSFLGHGYTIRQGLFEFMPVLRVLDLSWSRLENLPDEIGDLSELRYLNLQGTHIRTLPKGLGKLENLRLLNLDNTHSLSSIPPEAITTLWGLQALGLYDSAYNFVLPCTPFASQDDNHLMEGTGTSSSSSLQVSMKDRRYCWDKLEELRLTVRTLSSLQALLEFGCSHLCVLDLRIILGYNSDITTEDLTTELGGLEKLRSLDVIGDYSDLEVLFDRGGKFQSSLEKLYVCDVHKITVVIEETTLRNLRCLKICGCEGIHDLGWVQKLPCLEDISVHDCKGIEELFPTASGLEGVDEARDFDRSSLLALKCIVLWTLPRLKSISGKPLLLPSLQYLVVCYCPQLTKLPLGSDSAQNIRGIFGDTEWWERLEWYPDVDGRSVESRFLPSCQPLEVSRWESFVVDEIYSVEDEAMHNRIFGQRNQSDFGFYPKINYF